MLNITTQLKSALLTAYNAKGYNNHCYAQVLNHQVTQSHDESSTQVLVISFREYSSSYKGDNIEEDYHDAEAAEYLQKEAVNFLKRYFNTLLTNFDEAHIDIREIFAMTHITGYQYAEEAAIYASILCTDETLHITVMAYPQ